MSNLWFNIQFGTWFWQWERMTPKPTLTQSEYIIRNPHLQKFKIYTAFGFHFD